MSNSIAAAFVAITLVGGLRAAVNVERIEQLIAEGKPVEAIALLEPALARQPNNPKLLYNFGVASYAAGRYDDALLAFDQVEASGNESLVRKARAQKGNAEFHLGLNSRTDNLDETTERWKTSLAHYRLVLKEAPADQLTRNNHDIVQKMLLDLLLKQAQPKLAAAMKENWADRKIEQLREAMEKFQEAPEVDTQNQEAREGEQKARETLAVTLAREGEKKATPKPNLPLARQINEIEKGVNQLEEANELVPENTQIQEQLEKARETLAKALVEKAREEIQQAREIEWDKGKFEKLDQAIEHAQQAQELAPKNKEAKQVEQEAKQELAKLHEEKGDELAQRAERASLEYQTEWLTEALDHYVQAEELKPEDQQLAAKADQTQERLEEALQKLADKLMKDPAKPEQLEEKAARLEGAETALQDLEQLKPSPKTEEQLDDVQKRLAAVREQLAEQARQQLAREEAERLKNAQKPKPSQQQAQAKPQEIMPELELPPKPEEQGGKADGQPKKGKDY